MLQLCSVLQFRMFSETNLTLSADVFFLSMKFLMHVLKTQNDTGVGGGEMVKDKGGWWP